MCGPGAHETRAYTAFPPETPWPALRLWTEAPVPSPSVICPPSPGPAKGPESQSPTARCRSGLEMWLPGNRLLESRTKRTNQKTSFSTNGWGHTPKLRFGTWLQAGHRFRFPITGSATWPNSASFPKGPVYSLHCQMVAAFSSADTIVEFLQLPISNYRNILAEGSKANRFAMFSVPATSQISSPGFHVPGAELQSGGHHAVVRYWRNSPTAIFPCVRTFHLQYLCCSTLFNNKNFFFLLSIQDVGEKTSPGQQQQRWLLTNLNGLWASPTEARSHCDVELMRFRWEMKATPAGSGGRRRALTLPRERGHSSHQ